MDSLISPQQRFSSPPITTAGALYPDGSAIELLAGNRLLWSSDSQTTIVTDLDVNGQRFAAAPLTQEWEAFLRLPEKAADHGSTEDVVRGLALAAHLRAGLEGDHALLAAAWALTTHLAGAIPVPLMSLTGSADPVATLQYFSAVCRHPLPISEPSWQDLLEVPTGLCPTLILNQPSKRFAQRLWTACAVPGFGFLHRNAVRSVSCTAAMYTPQAISVPNLTLHRVAAAETTAGKLWLQESEMTRLASEFQPLLLDFRLHNWQAASQASVPVSGFSAPMRTIAHSLGAALSQSPEMQSEVLEALQRLDGENVIERSLSGTAVLVEVLLDLIHAGNKSALVNEITDNVNGRLLSFRERSQHTPKAVGLMLREELGLSAKRTGEGYRQTLDARTSRRVHELATEYGVAPGEPWSDCDVCQGLTK